MFHGAGFPFNVLTIFCNINNVSCVSCISSDNAVDLFTSFSISFCQYLVSEASFFAMNILFLKSALDEAFCASL